MWSVTPGCVQPSLTVVIHVCTQSSIREEAVCWQGLEYSPFPLFFTPEGSSVPRSCCGCSSEPVVTQPSVTASDTDATGMGL